MGFTHIPATSVVRYISGLHSLNLDLEDGTGFDWHFMAYWKDGKIPIKLYGEGQDVNTNHIYGFWGVANREERMQALGLHVRNVYVAHHHRAICDLVYEYITKYEKIGYAKGCVDDYFFSEDDVEKLFFQLVKLKDYLDEDGRSLLLEWLSKEFKPVYRRWRSGALQSRTGGNNKSHIESGESYYGW